MSFSPLSLYRLFRANPAKTSKTPLLRQFVVYYPNSNLTQERGKKTGKGQWGSHQEKGKNIPAVALGEVYSWGPLVMVSVLWAELDLRCSISSYHKA